MLAYLLIPAVVFAVWIAIFCLRLGVREWLRGPARPWK